jgi:hypothetical protein
MTRLQRLAHWTLAGILLVLLGTAPMSGQLSGAPSEAAAPPSAAARADQLAAYDQVGLSFERNDGQVNAAVRYLARANGYTAFLGDRAATLVYRTGHGADSTYAVLNYQLQGGRPSTPVAGDELPGKSNYFIGNDPAQWRKDVPTYGRVTYAGVYPGVDLAYYGTRGALQYDFIVAAGADPSAIHLQIAGADRLELAGGDLLMHTAAGVIRQSAPVIYQDGPNGREPVSGGFALGAGSTVSFNLGRYDASRPLVIDPATLVWSTYLGGDIDSTRPQHGGDWMVATAVDATGNVYVAGSTDAVDFPLVNRPPQLPSSMHNFFNLSITKFNPSATAVLYSSYLGGTRNSTSGSGENGNGMDIAVDSSNRPYIVGWTNDDTFPVTAGVIQTVKGNPTQYGRGNNAADMVAARLSATGNNLDWSTFYGGSGNDYGYGIALGSGASPNVYLYGATRSADFPTTSGAYDTARSGNTDAVIVRLNNTATTRLYSTYLGGSTDEAEVQDETYGGGNAEDTFYHGGGIAVDANGAIYVGGWTTSTNFPTTNGADTAFTGTRNGFLVKLNPAGGSAADLLYGTYIGTAGRTEVRDLAINGADNVYVAGRTEGITTTAGAYQTAYGGSGDAFVSRYDTSSTGAASLDWASYLGGATAVGSTGAFWSESAYGIAVNSQGSVFLTGLAGPAFPTTADRYSSFAGGATGTLENMDAFLAVMDSTGAGLIYSTWFGGREEDWGSGISVDANNCAYLSGSTLSGNHSNPPRAPEGSPYYPTTAGVAYTTYQGGKMDGWVTKFCVTGPTGIEVSRVQAVALDKGGVGFSWTTASEWQHAGFIVERADGPGAAFAPVSPLLLPAPGGSYTYVDPQGTATMRYRLVAVDSRGHREVGTPFSPSGKAQALPSLPTGSQAAAPPEGRVAPALAAGPRLPLAQRPVRLTVPGAGIVRVTYDQLAATTSLTGVNPDYLLLTSGPASNRQAVPLALHLAKPGVFAPGDFFDFIAPEVHTPNADGSAYYLSVGRAPGPRMALTGQPGGPDGTVASFNSTLALEENHIYWAAAPRLGAPQPEGPWFWADAVTDASAVVTLHVPDVVPRTAATLRVTLQGFINDAGTNGYHNVQFVLNGSPLGSYDWYGDDLTKTELAVRAGVLQSGDNTLEVLVDNTYSPLDGVYLNAATVQYTRSYQAAGDTLRFITGQGGLAVRGFSSPAVVAYDVTDAAAPLAVRATTGAEGGSYTLRYHPTTSGARTVLAAGPGGLLTPTEISPTSALNLRAGSADYVVIAHDSLLGAAQPLAAYHANTGLRATVVPVSAIYDQFGNGRPDPVAIRAFLGAAAQWPSAPRYVVLLGAASVDPHNYLGLNTADLVPTEYSLTTFSGRTASDAALLPANSNLALGRLPARTPAEAAAVVNKLIGYMTTPHTWPQTVTLLADAADAGRFDASSEALAGILGSTPTERLYESQYGGTTATRLVDAFNSGRAVINFYGHGSASQWGTGDLFDNNRLSQLVNAGREPFVTAMTCHNGDYTWAADSSTLTALVLQPSGGAIGALGSTATSLDAGQRQLAEAFYARLLAGDRLGDALRLAQAATADPDVRAQFALLGDPALRVDLGH